MIKLLHKTKKDFFILNIKISETNKTLSANGGLLLVNKLFDTTGGGDFLKPYLPTLERSTPNSLAKLKGFLLSFAQGVDCLDDIERLHASDDLFSRLVGRSFTAKSYGDFLRDFSKENLIGLRNSLPRFAVKLRQALGLSMDEIIFDIDSTENEQHGKKMEEVRPTRTKACALDTVQVFDSEGLIYWQDTRPGATYTSNFSSATNIFAHEMAPEKVIELYRGRGNAENFIKEIKYGFDLKHYPCLKFDANRVYGILAAYAHLFVRTLSLMNPQKRKHFSKLTRFKLIHLACQIVRSGREVTIKFMTRHYEEVRSYFERIKNLQKDFGFLGSGACTDAH